MTNCDWTNSKLEAYFCDTLTDEELRLFGGHLTTCEECSRQVESLKAVDPLVRGVMQRRLALAQRAVHHNGRPRVLRLGLSAVGLAAAAVLLVLGMRFLQETPAPPVANHPPEVPSPIEPVKKDALPQVDPRSKPTDGGALKPPISQPELDVAVANGPEFSIADAQGYLTTLETVRGTAFLFGVLSSDQKTAVTNFQQIYDSYQSDRGIRMLAVARHRQDEFRGFTFPLFFNNGSRLMGVQEGQFLLIDATGKSRLEGSLSDPASITRLKNQLMQLGIR
jgi:hypothetical protein